ncbi:hypothetical protein QAD02_001063 [Eretmocerus hayati]|uniref:Uncharacterized protein n=1 Tax=Eretmocerus hayati TaxID=131215 RepID=A0ACC2NF03_9HYME|nr:hypothetical protein QAD02_001063 [Eretmocerus hayati]
MNSFSYELIGTFSISKTNVSDPGLSKVIKRSVVIAAYQLFLDSFTQNPRSNVNGLYWHDCQPYVAAHLNKTISDHLKAQKNVSEQQQFSFNEKRFVPNGPDGRVPDGSIYENDITGCFETVEESVHITVSYNFEIQCIKGNVFKGTGITSPEPHDSWRPLFEVVRQTENSFKYEHLYLSSIDKALQYKQK